MCTFEQHSLPLIPDEEGRKDWNEANWVALSFLYFILFFYCVILFIINDIEK